MLALFVLLVIVACLCKLYASSAILRARHQKALLLQVNSQTSQVFPQTAWYFCPILNKFDFFSTDFYEVPNIEFHPNTSSGVPADSSRQTDSETDGRMDGQDESDRRCSRIFQSA